MASWEVAVCRDSVEEISVQLLLCRIHVGLTLLLSASDRDNFKRFKILAASRRGQLLVLISQLTRTVSNNCRGHCRAMSAVVFTSRHVQITAE